MSYLRKTICLQKFRKPQWLKPQELEVIQVEFSRNELIPILGDGNQTRDFTYIGNDVPVNRWLLETSASDGCVKQ